MTVCHPKLKTERLTILPMIKTDYSFCRKNIKITSYFRFFEYMRYQNRIVQRIAFIFGDQATKYEILRD